MLLLIITPSSIDYLLQDYISYILWTSMSSKLNKHCEVDMYLRCYVAIVITTCGDDANIIILGFMMLLLIVSYKPIS